jgi:hypothetical protein
MECLPEVTMSPDRTGGVLFRLLGEVDEDGILIPGTESDRAYGKGTQAYKNLMKDKHTWVGDIISPSVPSSGNIHDYSRLDEDSFDIINNRKSFSYSEPESQHELIRSTRPQERSDAGVAPEGKMTYDSLPEPGGVAPSSISGSRVHKPMQNWVDNVLSTFEDYYFEVKKGSREDWIKLGSPNTIPYTLLMKSRTNTDSPPEKFLAAQSGNSIVWWGQPRGIEEEVLISGAGADENSPTPVITQMLRPFIDHVYRNAPRGATIWDKVRRRVGFSGRSRSEGA